MTQLPPPHPSLPRPPVAGPQTQFLQPSTSYAAYHTYSSHYAQAYSQMAPQSAPAAGFNFSNRLATTALNFNQGKTTPAHTMSTWYHAGNNRCSHPGCAFRGSQQSVEIHRMDRHLIYPPDWDKRRKKKSEWDADPSLKGKPVPIQGTNVTLDTPELIDAWIAERKKRFPTSSRVEDKKRKLAEAVERGQLDLNPSRFARPPKRPKTDRPDGQASQMRMPGRNSRNRRRQRKPQGSATKANVAPTSPSPSPHKCEQESDDDDAAPEELSSKMPDLAESIHGDETISAAPSTGPQPQAQKRLKEPQPRGPAKNIFASRPALLRNLLLPEIHMTVSNLSQAIRFLVDNDFLRNVELKPGQAAERQKIYVLNSQESSIT